jgi:hypothetical protein
MPFFSDMKSRSLTSILSDDNNENNNNNNKQQQLLNGRLNNCKIDGSTKILNLNNLGVQQEWLTAAPSIPTTTTSIMHYANRQTKSHNKTNNYILWILTPVAARYFIYL